MSLLLACLPLGLAHAAPAIALERVEILALDPGTWPARHAPLVPTQPAMQAVRLALQVQPEWRLGGSRWVLGTSVAALSVAHEAPIGGRFSWTAGVQTRLGLPNGAFAGVLMQHGVLRSGVGTSVRSDATWARPRWDHWEVLPALSLSIGRRPAGATEDTPAPSR